MIEFKAECGHTVRAKDEDAGKVVRCSYCGEEAQVPDSDAGDHELEHLFAEVEKTGVYDSPTDRKRVKRMKGKPQRPVVPQTPRGEFNPFGFVLKLCYACVILAVLIFAGKEGYRYFADSKTKAVPPPGGSGVPSGNFGNNGQGGRPSGMGLLRPKLSQDECGIYVDSVPSGAEVFITDRGRVGELASVYSLGEKDLVASLRAGESAGKLQPGREYDVFVALPINDPNLTRMPRYLELRREYEQSMNDRLLERYFIPDGSVSITTDTLPMRPMMLIRRYESRVFDRTWTPVTALFLPASLSLGDMIKYLPKRKAFGFDEDVVRAELEYYGVKMTDRRYIVDILERIGMVSYRVDDSPVYRIFQINLLDGQIYRRPETFRHTAGVGPARGLMPGAGLAMR